jgi:transposase
LTFGNENVGMKIANKALTSKLSSAIYVGMYIATVPNRTYKPTVLLRESYRKGGKVSTKTLHNLSSYTPQHIEALKRAFRGEFDNVGNVDAGHNEPQVGEVFGTYFALKYLADELGITKILSGSKVKELALFLVLTRIAHQGSRLSAVRFAQHHAVADILGVSDFDEDDLYNALDFLDASQESVEEKLYQRYLTTHGKAPELVLYDVTSSYLEGEDNELAAYGYNRDGKRGKTQIVIGLLTDRTGEPIAVRVFKGNTADPSTVAEQIDALKTQFKIKEVIFVGDRGMVKTKAQEALNAESYRYITALTDAQTRTLLSTGVIQIGFFDTKLYEVEVEANGKRYVLMRNEDIKSKEQKRVDDKVKTLQALIKKRNVALAASRTKRANKNMEYLQKWLKTNKLDKTICLEANNSVISYKTKEGAALTEKIEKAVKLIDQYNEKAKVSTSIDKGIEHLQKWLKRYKLHSFITVEHNGLEISYKTDESAKAEYTLLDGCYTLVTDVASKDMDAKSVHESYKQLQNVERDFRTLKTGFLEIRPIFVRKESRTRGHVFVAMLALKIVRLFRQKLEASKLSCNVEDALHALSSYVFLKYKIGRTEVSRLPKPSIMQRNVFAALGLVLPSNNKEKASVTKAADVGRKKKKQK